MPTLTHAAIPARLPGRFNDLVMMKPPRAIHDSLELEDAIELVDQLMALPHNTLGQRDYAETWIQLIEAYESEHHAIETGDLTAVGILQSLCDAQGMTPSDLGRLLGNRTLGHKVLSGERELSKANIMALCERFKVSADLFLRR